MITIYGVLRSRASRNVWLAEEAGIPWKHVPVIQAARVANPGAADAPLNTRSAAFLRKNPNGLVPAMEDDGLLLCESLAINLYLARKYGGALGPQDAAEDGLMTMWSFWAATTVEPHSILIVYHRVNWPEEKRDAKVADAAVEALRQPIAVLNDALAKDKWLVGGRFTVADINVSEVVRYAMPATELFENAPAVRDWMARCHARPAFAKMMELRNGEPA